MKVNIGTYKFYYEKRLTNTEKAIGTSWAIVTFAFVVGGTALALAAAMSLVGAALVLKQ